ncbi:SRPBCC family protein [Lacisediminimonas sp.]|uniref:SRPBCC family protein n=1 Tax=Lacisediminimonas sp. TaxID=3060582 RepID=UPI00271E9726|nr:SRPBCC family protein [Lacisediminimonas sp.]MDO8299582.1 SRPBCC family protein [Lacisediminimonas sp.]
MDRYETEDSGAGIALAVLGGMALGAIAMYLTDPEQGRRRRSLLQKTVRNMSSRTGDLANSAWRDASSRFAGLQQSAGRLAGQRSSKPIDDHVLEARVRSKLNRTASSPHAIEVVADQGRITLSGLVEPDEREVVLDLVQSIPGVDAVRVDLDDGARGLRRASGGLPLIALAAGGALLGYYGLSRGRGAGSDIIRTGLHWLSGLSEPFHLRAFDWRRGISGAVDGQPVEMSRTIDIKAAPDAVFDVWSNTENFPHFMSHVVEVRDLGQQRSHWAVRGPGGAQIEWNSVLTRVERPHALEWESEPGSMIDNSGAVYLEPRNGGGTRATVQMAYRPPAGALGTTVAMLMGSDPGRQLEDDLKRMRNFIESGVPLQEAEPPMTTKGQMLH